MWKRETCVVVNVRVHLCVPCCSSVHYHHFPLPVCGDVWGHGSWPSDDLCCSLPGDSRESPPRPKERQWGTVSLFILKLVERACCSCYIKDISIESFYMFVIHIWGYWTAFFLCRCSTWSLPAATSSCWWAYFPSILVSFTTTASPNPSTCSALDGAFGPCSALKEPTGRKWADDCCFQSFEDKNRGRVSLR